MLVNLFLIVLLVDSMGHLGIALSLSLASYFNVIALSYANTIICKQRRSERERERRSERERGVRGGFLAHSAATIGGSSEVGAVIAVTPILGNVIVFFFVSMCIKNAHVWRVGAAQPRPAKHEHFICQTHICWVGAALPRPAKQYKKQECVKSIKAGSGLRCPDPP